MSKKNKPDPNQLWLDFTTAAQDLRAAVDRFEAAATGMLEAVEPVTKSKVSKEVSDVRKLFNRKVRILAGCKYGNDFREAYMAVYERMRSSLDFSLYAELKASCETLVDVLDRRGKLPEALAVVNSLL